MSDEVTAALRAVGYADAVMRFAQLSYDDVMRRIDEQLAQGDQTPVRKMRTAPEGFVPRPQFPNDGEFDDLSDAAEAQRIRDWDND